MLLEEDSTATIGPPNSSQQRMVRIALAVGVWLVALMAPVGTQGNSVDVISLVDMYAQGRHDEAVAKAAAIPDLGPFRLRFVQDTPVWVNADPARLEARSAAVAAFLLELTGARLESDWGRFSDLIEFTCLQLRKTGPNEFERAWHAASHALAGRARARTWLLGESARLPHQNPIVQPDMPKWAERLQRLEAQKQPPVTHLTHALERFPEDPHFQLSRVVAWTWGRDGEPIRNVRRRDDDDRPRRITRAPQLEAIVALEPLTLTPEVAAEAWLRTGLVHFTVGDHAAALRAFEAAQPIATEPAMKYLAHFNAGRSLEALGRPDDAMREYGRALDVVPDAESATVMLTSLQFTRDDRDAALPRIDRVFNRPPAPTDPGRLIGYGSFLRWPALKAAMRTALSAYPGAPK
jgi:tetratricopeptide (TPR) repeat protein